MSDAPITARDRNNISDFTKRVERNSKFISERKSRCARCDTVYDFSFRTHYFSL